MLGIWTLWKQVEHLGPDEGRVNRLPIKSGEIGRNGPQGEDTVTAGLC